MYGVWILNLSSKWINFPSPTTLGQPPRFVCGKCGFPCRRKGYASQQWSCLCHTYEVELFLLFAATSLRKPGLIAGILIVLLVGDFVKYRSLLDCSGKLFSILRIQPNAFLGKKVVTSITKFPFPRTSYFEEYSEYP